MSIKEIITRLCEQAGPSGFETGAAETAAELLKPYMDQVSIDIMGNVIGVKKCGREGAKKLLLDAHLDEIGFIVTGLEEGFVKLATLGGVDARMLPACEIILMTEPPIPGVICTMPPHVLSAEEQEKAIKLEDFYLDVGLNQEEAEKRIPLGTPGVYRQGVHALGDSLICGKTMDDRACFACLVRAAELLQNVELNVDLWILGSTQEEVGSRGAETAAFAVWPDYAVAVDVGHAKTPDCSNWSTQEIGKGPVIGIGPNMNRSWNKKIMVRAEQAGIPYQTGVEPYGESGTNATVLQTTREGVCTTLFSLPLKYMHTPVEVISLQDAENTARLLAETAKSF